MLCGIANEALRDKGKLIRRGIKVNQGLMGISKVLTIVAYAIFWL